MAKSIAELKRTLRDLKRMEINIRFGGDAETAHGKLVWDEFFSLKSSKKVHTRYDLQAILHMSRDEFKVVLSEFFYFMYFRIYREKGFSGVNFYDPTLLEILDLPLGASEQEIKNKFRTLAKKHHPDMGGDAEKFIELMDVYGRLTGNP